MPKCQVYGCPNQPGACNRIDGKKRSFFMIPDGKKNPQLCRIWIQSLGPTKYQAETFRANKCRTVCEEHFTPDCFQEDKYAKILGYIPNRKLLKPGAYPTLVGEKAHASRLKRLHAKDRRRKELEAKQMTTTCSPGLLSSETCQEDCSCCWTEVTELPDLLKETPITNVMEDHNYCFPRKIEPEDAYRRIEVGLTEEQLRYSADSIQQPERFTSAACIQSDSDSRESNSKALSTAQPPTGGFLHPVGEEAKMTTMHSDSPRNLNKNIRKKMKPLIRGTNIPERSAVSDCPGMAVEGRLHNLRYDSASSLRYIQSLPSYPSDDNISTLRFIQPLPSYPSVDNGSSLRYIQPLPSSIRSKEFDKEVVVKLEVDESQPDSDETILEVKAVNWLGECRVEV